MQVCTPHNLHQNGFKVPGPDHQTREAGASPAASFEVLEAWHLTAAEHDAVVRDVLVPLARLHASSELACTGKTRNVRCEMCLPAVCRFIDS
jgi:hypothetical protein